MHGCKKKMQQIRPFMRAMLIVCALLLLLSSCAQGSRLPTYTDDLLRVHYVDVGQGDCSLLELPGGETLLIDGGPEAAGDSVVAYMKAVGIDDLDYVVATHAHEDHIGGLPDVLARYHPRTVYMPSYCVANTKIYNAFVSMLKRQGLSLNDIVAGVTLLDENGVVITVVSPTKDFGDQNENSAMLKVVYGEHVFLFTGDAGKKAEKDITADISADVLQVGHHGSKGSSSKEFLQRVQPRLAIIPVGKNNSYSHPTREVLGLLSSMNIRIFRTDEDGTVVVDSDGKTLTVYTSAGGYSPLAA